MANSSIPKSIRLNLSEWDILSTIAHEQGTSRHRIMATAIRSIIQNQNPETA